MRYDRPAAFRQALEERLRQRERETGEPLVRMRKRLVFERCMARLQRNPNSPWVVKGGFALELRLGMQARMTKDLDLGVDLGYFAGRIFSATELEQTLRDDLASMAEDDFTFTVPQTAAQSLPIQGVQAYRFTVEARLDGRGFDTIKVDVGLGDPLLPPLEELSGSDLLSFAEIPVVTIRVTSCAQHFAEKVHALTRPFDDRVNTRVKDLADIMLLMNLGLPDPSSVMTVITEIFDARKSHPIPKQIQEAPSTWGNSFAAMAKELNIAEAKPDQATARLNNYWSKLFSENK